MTLSRRSLFAALAGLVAAPFVKKDVLDKLPDVFKRLKQPEDVVVVERFYDHRYRNYPSPGNFRVVRMWYSGDCDKT